jgi:hypothetical protein
MLPRHPDQTVVAKGIGFTEIEPPVDFAAQAYEAGLEPGTGAVSLRPGYGFVRATLDGKIHGVLVRLHGIGATDEAATAHLLEEIKKWGVQHG